MLAKYMRTECIHACLCDQSIETRATSQGRQQSRVTTSYILDATYNKLSHQTRVRSHEPQPRTGTASNTLHELPQQAIISQTSYQAPGTYILTNVYMMANRHDVQWAPSKQLAICTLITAPSCVYPFPYPSSDSFKNCVAVDKGSGASRVVCFAQQRATTPNGRCPPSAERYTTQHDA